MKIIIKYIFVTFFVTFLLLFCYFCYYCYFFVIFLLLFCYFFVTFLKILTGPLLGPFSRVLQIFFFFLKSFQNTPFSGPPHLIFKQTMGLTMFMNEVSGDYTFFL